MEPKLILPQVIGLTGQSGAGKGTASRIIRSLCDDAGIPTLYISSGDLIVRRSKGGSYMAKKMRELHERGKLNPDFVISSLLFHEIDTLFKEGHVLILDDVPRSKRIAESILEWFDLGFINSLKFIEIIAPDLLCEARIIERTKEDGRVDISVDGQPGVPDIKKIKDKMSWWTANRPDIIQCLLLHGCYTSVHNEGSEEDLKNRIIAALTERATP